jgi:membrane-associated phospholipid phosphatase
VLNAGWAVALAIALQAGAPPPDAASPAWTDDQPFTRLFQNLGRDLQALPSIDTARLLGTGGAGTLIVRGADDNLAAWADREGESSFTPLWRAVGDGWIQAGAATGAYVVGRLSHRPAVTHIGSDLVRAQLLNGVVTRGLKLAVDRARPTGGAHAFPSGHASAAFTSAAVLHGHFGWKTGVPAYAVAGLVGWSRVRDRAHWMSDVLFGATLGTIAGRTVTGGHGRPSTWAIVPGATPGGAAVHVVRIGGS